MSINTSRTVRIFISSTFRDFAGERDELVKKVFPELRRRCKARFVELLEVDLRWGVTEEQSRRGETLRICLQEIDRCRPSTPVFFIGLLGERYGWIPEVGHYPKDVLADPDLQWVREHAGGKSVTELEILHGVLNNPAMAARAYFYFRKEGYQHRHWPEIQATYSFLKPEDFGNASESDAVKQRALKERVRQSGLWHEPQDYETPAEMAQRALADLWSEIDRAFPADEAPDEHERQWMEHEAFAQSRTKGYVPRAGLFDELNTVLKGRSPICRAITGQSGGGKSALVAAWMAQAKLPERTFVHYIGGTPESSTVRNILLRLMETIRRWGAVREPIPNDFGEAVQVLPQWLAQAAEKQKGGVLLVLDALNQMEEERDQRLWWLPKELPKGVRLVVSTLPGPSEEALRARGWLTEQTVIEVPPLTDPDRREIIASYLGRFTKKLEPRIVERLATAPQTSNALFLKVALDELRLRGRHEELGGMVEQMLEAKDPIALFVQVLKGLEEFDRDRPNLVREAMGYLHAARRGLTESELLQLLSEHPEPASQPLPMAVWSPLYLALEESLVSRFGRLGFFHDYLRQAVEQEYLDEEWERRKVHGRLGEMALAWNTERFSPTLRAYGLAYGAHHLRQEGDPEKLWTLLQDEGCRKAQQQEFKRVDESVEGLRHGVDVYAQQDGQTDEDDVRLCWLMLRCGEVVQEARTSLQPIFEEFRTRPLDDPNRVEDALSRLQILDEARFYQACQLLLYIECERSETEGKPISNPRMTKIVEAVEEKVPEGTEVTVTEWLEEKLVPGLRMELLERLAERTSEEDERRRCTSVSLASAKRWDDALLVCQRLENSDRRTDTLADIVKALSESGEWDRALHSAEGLVGEQRCQSLCELAKALAQSGDSIRSREVFALSLQVAETIEDPTVQSAAWISIAEAMASAGNPSDRPHLYSRILNCVDRIEDAYKKGNLIAGVAIAFLRDGKQGDAFRLIGERILQIGEVDIRRIAAAAVVFSNPGMAVSIIKLVRDDEQRAYAISEVAKLISQYHPDAAPRQWVGECVNLAQPIHEGKHRLVVLAGVGQAYAQLGDGATGRALLLQAASLIEGIADLEERYEALVQIAEGFSALGDRAQATVVAEASLHIAMRMKSVKSRRLLERSFPFWLMEHSKALNAVARMRSALGRSQDDFVIAEWVRGAIRNNRFRLASDIAGSIQNAVTRASALLAISTGCCDAGDEQTKGIAQRAVMDALGQITQENTGCEGFLELAGQCFGHVDTQSWRALFVLAIQAGKPHEGSSLRGRLVAEVAHALIQTGANDRAMAAVETIVDGDWRSLFDVAEGFLKHNQRKSAETAFRETLHALSRSEGRPASDAETLTALASSQAAAGNRGWARTLFLQALFRLRVEAEHRPHTGLGNRLRNILLNIVKSEVSLDPEILWSAWEISGQFYYDQLVVSSRRTIVAFAIRSGHAGTVYRLAKNTSRDDDSQWLQSLEARSFTEAGNLSAALEVANRLEDISTRIETLCDVAVTQHKAGDRTNWAALLDTAIELANGLEPGWGRESAMSRLAEAAGRWDGLTAPAEFIGRLFRIAQSVAEGSDNELRVILSIAKAIAQAGESSEVWMVLDRALTVAVNGTGLGNFSNSPRSRLVELTETLESLNDSPQRQDFWDRLVRSSTAIGDITDQFHLWLELALSLARTARHGESWAMLLRALELLDQINSTDDHERTGAIALVQAIPRGPAGSSRQQAFDKAVGWSEKLDDTEFRCAFLRVLSEAMAEVGDLDRSKMLLTTAIRCAGAIKSAGDQARALGEIVRILCQRHAPDAGLAKDLGTSAVAEEAFGFLASMEHEVPAGWLRLFAVFCPNRLEVSLQLTVKLVAAHIRVGRLGLAREIVSRCPQLCLNKILC